MSNLKKVLGERVRYLRKSRDLTQEKLAELANIEQRTISNVENGHSISYNVLQNIINAFDINYAEFFQLGEEIGKTDDEIIKEMIDTIPTLSSKELRTYYKILRDIKD